jgi:hypothetical protein
MTERPESDVYGHHLEMQRKREEWFAEKKRKAEEEERARKQAALESYLRHRAQEWRDYTGSEPTPEESANWQREFLAERLAEQEVEREVKLAEAEENYHF